MSKLFIFIKLIKDEDDETTKTVRESGSQVIDEFEIDHDTKATNKRPKYTDYVNNDDFKVLDCTEINFENEKRVCFNLDKLNLS